MDTFFKSLKKTGWGKDKNTAGNGATLLRPKKGALHKAIRDALADAGVV